MPDFAWFAFFAVLIVAFILLEGKRQERKYGKSSSSPNLLGVGMLETQKILQADREVAPLQQQLKGELVYIEAANDGEDLNRRKLG